MIFYTYITLMFGRVLFQRSYNWRTLNMQPSQLKIVINRSGDSPSNIKQRFRWTTNRTPCIHVASDISCSGVLSVVTRVTSSSSEVLKESIVITVLFKKRKISVLQRRGRKSLYENTGYISYYYIHIWILRSPF